MLTQEGYFRCPCGEGFFGRIYEGDHWAWQGVVKTIRFFDEHQNHGVPVEIWREPVKAYGRGRSPLKAQTV